MGLLSVESWIKSPSDRDIISRWTVGHGESRSHALELPAPLSPDRFRFLVVGDTGDAESSPAAVSPQQAVTQEMWADFQSALPPSLILHLGDVVYMTGEKRLYDRNFRRPYAPFLTPESTADNLVFRTPFFPVPGNHDYYDLRGWVRWLARVPLLGPGLKVLIRQLFAFGVPEGGSDMGRAFMEAFVETSADKSRLPLTYTPGVHTRLPNRYYRFRYGTADFFALDSNTLDAPPPWQASAESIREEAAQRIERLEEWYGRLDAALRTRQRRLAEWRNHERGMIARDPARREDICRIARSVATSLATLANSMRVDGRTAAPCAPPSEEAEMLSRRWQDAEEDLRRCGDGDIALRLIDALEEACDDACSAMRGVEECLSAVSQGSYKSGILQAREEVDRALDVWSRVVSSLPQDLCDEMRELSEQALDIQRELALEKRRTGFRPEDYDSAQLEWLKEGLEQSFRDNPDGWRIVFLHHPLYSAIHNHCERPDIQRPRANLMEILRGRAHLVLGGHAHAFEWFRSASLPGAGIIVSGGGGQISLRRSIFDPRLYARNRDLYRAMREAGATEWCGAGRGPVAGDGESGNLYHYLQVDVAPESLTVRPIGVRRLSADRYRREEPMPAYHVGPFDEGRPLRRSGRLVAVEISCNGQVTPKWAD